MGPLHRPVHAAPVSLAARRRPRRARRRRPGAGGLRQVLVALPNFTYNPSQSFHGWLRTLALNCRRDLQKRRAPLSESAATEAAFAPDPLESFIEREYRNQLAVRAMHILRSDFQPQTWQAVWELSKRDADNNAMQGKAVFVDTSGAYVASEKQQVAILGVEDVVVVTTDDAVLVARRQNSDGLRRVVERLKQESPALTQDHLKVHRPWGSYQSLDLGSRYQVKRIVVKQGGRLSLQLHHHRAEHWVVVRGTARVAIGDKVQMLHENESIYVPIGVHHRLENPGKIDLELIEVQTGSYLGEDDIERIEDDYNRS